VLRGWLRGEDLCLEERCVAGRAEPPADGDPAGHGEVAEAAFGVDIAPAGIYVGIPTGGGLEMGDHIRAGELEIWTEQVGEGPEVLLIGGAGVTVESWQFQLDGTRPERPS
jgi:hypothetical protein